MSRVGYRDFWTLTVSLAGRSEHRFHFDRPPSRADFLAACDRLPWTTVWRGDVLPAIARSPWPMVDFMCKAARSEVVDAGGLQVGEIDVTRHESALNVGYDRDRIAILSADREPAEARVPRDRRHESYMLLLRAQNRIMEAAADLPNDADTRAFIRGAIRDLYKAAGLFRRATPTPPNEGIES